MYIYAHLDQRARMVLARRGCVSEIFLNLHVVQQSSVTRRNLYDDPGILRFGETSRGVCVCVLNAFSSVNLILVVVNDGVHY